MTVGELREAGGSKVPEVIIVVCGGRTFVAPRPYDGLDEMDESSRVDFAVDEISEDEAVEVVEIEAGAGYLERFAAAAWTVGRTGADDVR